MRSISAPLRLALLAAGAMALAACDGHTSEEAPDNYGHGSNSRESFSDHQIDSRKDSRHFSATHGVDDANESPSPSPAAHGEKAGAF